LGGDLTLTEKKENTDVVSPKLVPGLQEYQKNSLQSIYPSNFVDIQPIDQSLE
jgi:hypothetical protein